MHYQQIQQKTQKRVLRAVETDVAINKPEKQWFSRNPSHCRSNIRSITSYAVQCIEQLFSLQSYFVQAFEEKTVVLLESHIVYIFTVQANPWTLVQLKHNGKHLNRLPRQQLY